MDVREMIIRDKMTHLRELVNELITEAEEFNEEEECGVIPTHILSSLYRAECHLCI